MRIVETGQFDPGIKEKLFKHYSPVARTLACLASYKNPRFAFDDLKQEAYLELWLLIGAIPTNFKYGDFKTYVISSINYRLLRYVIEGQSMIRVPDDAGSPARRVKVTCLGHGGPSSVEFGQNNLLTNTVVSRDTDILSQIDVIADIGSIMRNDTERQVVSLRAKGLNDVEVAAQLGISPRFVGIVRTSLLTRYLNHVKKTS